MFGAGPVAWRSWARARGPSAVPRASVPPSVTGPHSVTGARSGLLLVTGVHWDPLLSVVGAYWEPRGWCDGVGRVS